MGIFSLAFPAVFLYAEDRFAQLRREEIEAKQRRAEELTKQADSFQRQLEEERRQNARAQEKIWKDFTEGLEVERKNLQGQMLTLEERQRRFETELEKKRVQDELSVKEKQNEIQLLMLEMQRLRAEVEQDKKIFEEQVRAAKNRPPAEILPDRSPTQDKVQTARSEGEALENDAIKIGSANGRQIMGEGQFQMRQIRPEYYLEIGDILEIDVWRVPDFSRVVSVRPDGRISLPLIGDLYVYGVSLVEIRDVLTKKLAEYIRNPQVSISIRQFGGRKFIILGEINSPGVFRFQQEVSLLEAIALAGGFKADAKRGKVMVIRGDIRKEPQVKIINANVQNILKKGMISENIFIMPNDIIYVAKDFIGDYREIIDSLISPALDTTIDFFVLRSAIRTAQDRHLT